MIRHVPRSELDNTWWDAQLERCSNRLWYACSWVLDVAAPGWEALIDDRSGAMMPLTWRRKFGMDYLFQPYGLQQLGVFSPAGLSNELCHAFLEAIPRRYRLVDICLNDRMPLSTSGHVHPNTQQTLALDRGIAALREGYSKGHRRNLRKAIPPEVRYSDRISAAQMLELFIATTARRHGGLSARDGGILAALMAGAIERAEGSIVGYLQGDRLIAAACLIERFGRVILFKAGCTREGAAFNAMFHLGDRLIADRAGSGVVLDFAGSNTATVARFNEGFGAGRSVYFRLRRNELPCWMRIFKR